MTNQRSRNLGGFENDRAYVLVLATTFSPYRAILYASLSSRSERFTFRDLEISAGLYAHKIGDGGCLS